MPPNTSHSRHVVTAVIVAHDGARLLPGLIQAIRDQTRPVDRAVGVDTGSRDRSGSLLAELLGTDAVFGMDPGTGYGAAVARALQHPAARRSTGVSDPGSTEWIWLLHDDCQPAADALEVLLRAASRYETAAVLGPKLRDLADRRVLRELGITTDRAGRRLSGIEPGEIDQGQHDGNRAVMAVSTAGMLVRRDVWEKLGGFDPMLPLFRDDIDFCWRVHGAGHDVRVVTDAVVYHRELSARHSRRPGIPVAGHPRLLDRRSALYVFAVNLPFVPLLTVMAGCVAGSLLRATYFLVTKQQRRAFGHLSALAWVFGHPVRVWQGRRRRAAGRKRAYAVLRPRLPHGKTLSRMAESAVGMLSRSSVYEGGGEHGGASDDPDDDLPLPPENSLLRRVLTSPGVLLFLTLAVITVVAEHSLIGSLLRGSGTLAGGALVPAWGGASDLWHEYLAGYHAAGVGSAASAPPYLGVVAAVATVLGGKPSLAVDVLLLGCVPIAGMAAFFAARRVTPALAARIWIALTYALLPVATGAVAAGRLGSAVAFMLLPLIGIMVGRMFTRPPRMARRAAWGAGLLVAVAAAFVPLLLLVAMAFALGALLAVVASRRVPGGRRLGRAAGINAIIVAVVAAVVLMPWTFQLFSSPSAFLLEAGIQQPGLAVAGLRPEPLLLLSPGGPGLPPAWATAGLLLPAFCSLLLNRRRSLVLAGWGVALSGLVIAVVVSRMRVTSPVTGDALPAWPGIALAIAAAGLLLAATPVLEWAAGTAWGLAVSRASLATRARLAGRRGTAALILGMVAMTAPVIAAGYWLDKGVQGPLGAAGTPVLPPFVAASSASQGQVRTLVLRGEHGVLTYQVLRNSDPVLGETELTQASAAMRPLSTAVASLAATDSGDSQAAAQSLGQFAVGYVLLPAPVDPVLAGQLNGVASLQPLTVSSAYDLWRVAGAAGRVRVVSAAGTVVTVPSGVVGADSVVAPGMAGTLVLAEPAGGWSATLNGRALVPLPQPVGGWAQGFVLPAGGGHLVIGRDEMARDIALGGEAAALLVAFVLALPGTRSATAASAELTEGAPADGITDQPASHRAGTGPGVVVPGNVTPGAARRSATGPRPALPAAALRDAALPDAALPDAALPDAAVPVGAMPAEVAPAEVAPADVVPVAAMWAGGVPAEEVPAEEVHGEPAFAAAWPSSASSASSASSVSPASSSASAVSPTSPESPSSPRKRSGSHRAPRHSKPTRVWRGKSSPAQQDEAGRRETEPLHTDEWTPQAQLPQLPQRPETPETLETPETPERPWEWEEPPDPQREQPRSDARPPWELGDTP